MEKHKQKKLLIAMGGIFLLLVIIGGVYSLIQNNIQKTIDQGTIEVDTTTENVVDTAVEEVIPKESSLSFGDARTKNISSRVGSYLEKEQLFHALAPATMEKKDKRTIRPSFNDYLTIVDIKEDTLAEELSIDVKISLKKFAKDFATKRCITDKKAIETLTSSGAKLLTGSGTQLISLHFFIDSEDGISQVYTRDVRYSDIEELKEDVFMKQYLNTETLKDDTYLVTVVPSCSTIYPHNIQSATEYIAQIPFTKETTINEKSQTPKALMTIVSPKIDTETQTAFIEVPYEVPGMTSVKIPYIQTSRDIQAEVEVDINSYFRDIKYATLDLDIEQAKGMVENEAFSVLFELYRDGILSYRQESSMKQDSLLNDSYATPYVQKFTAIFPQIDKGDYTLVAKLRVHTFENNQLRSRTVGQQIAKHIGIGDVYMLLGDVTSEGRTGLTYTGSFSSWKAFGKEENALRDSTGRLIPQPTKECEVKKYIQLSDVVCEESVTSTLGYANTLAKQLAKKFEYPVVVLNESMPEGVSLKDLIRYLDMEDTPLRKRMNQLHPQSVLFHQGALEFTYLLDPAKDLANGYSHGYLESLEKIVPLIEEISNNATFYMSVPQYIASESIFSEPYALATLEFLSKKEQEVRNGPNLYKLYYETLLSKDGKEIYAANEKSEYMINQAGYDKVAETWLPYLLTK